LREERDEREREKVRRSFFFHCVQSPRPVSSSLETMPPDPTPPGPTPGEDDAPVDGGRRLGERERLAECVLSSSWVGTAVGCALAVPMGVRRKSLTPLLVLGVGGTLVDMGVGLARCGGLSGVVGEARRRGEKK